MLTLHFSAQQSSPLSFQVDAIVDFDDLSSLDETYLLLAIVQLHFST